MKKIVLVLVLVNQFIWSQVDSTSTITICWDTSSSMYARNLENDFSVLESYFTKTEKAEVQLLGFDNSVTEKNFTVLAGDWHLLREELEGLAYDGATIFSNLKGKPLTKNFLK